MSLPNGGNEVLIPFLFSQYQQKNNQPVDITLKNLAHVITDVETLTRFGVIAKDASQNPLAAYHFDELPFLTYRLICSRTDSFSSTIYSIDDFISQDFSRITSVDFQVSAKSTNFDRMRIAQVRYKAKNPGRLDFRFLGNSHFIDQAIQRFFETTHFNNPSRDSNKYFVGSTSCGVQH